MIYLEVCIKHFKYLSEKSAASLTPEEEEFMKTMQDIDTLYKSEMNRARLEGERVGEERGEQRGEQRGEIRGQQELLLRQLNRRMGSVPVEAAATVKTLNLERLEQLGEDLLDFTQIGDLTAWLDVH